MYVCNYFISVEVLFSFSYSESWLLVPGAAAETAVLKKHSKVLSKSVRNFFWDRFQKISKLTNDLKKNLRAYSQIFFNTAINFKKVCKLLIYLKKYSIHSKAVIISQQPRISNFPEID